MTTEEQEKPKLFSNEEIVWIVKAFLSHPERIQNGATEEEIKRVVDWAGEIKIKVMTYLGILHEIYSGNFVLKLTEDDVVMSVSPVNIGEGRNVDKYLNKGALLS